MIEQRGVYPLEMSQSPSPPSSAGPVIKWVGGKRQLLQLIRPKLLPWISQGRTYIEPFVGGGAVYFDLPKGPAEISDVNSSLTNLYRVVQNQPGMLLENCVQLEQEYNNLNDLQKRDFYLAKRSEFNLKIDGMFSNREGIQGAGLFVFLNKAGFNGMYRENRDGEFNIPFGKRSQIKLLDDKNLVLASEKLETTQIFTRSYVEGVEPLLEKSSQNAVVYFDPPYAPLSRTSSFEGYNAENLDGFDQIKLRDIFVLLTNHGVPCVLSNSSAPEIIDLYRDFLTDDSFVSASRAISASSAGRARVKEVLIDNFSKL